MGLPDMVNSGTPWSLFSMVLYKVEKWLKVGGRMELAMPGTLKGRRPCKGQERPPIGNSKLRNHPLRPSWCGIREMRNINPNTTLNNWIKETYVGP